MNDPPAPDLPRKRPRGRSGAERPGPAEAPWPDEPLALWEGVGVEIEMVIVDARSLDVRPIADRLMEAAAGAPGVSEVARGPMAWSNELALHVLELKTNGPARELVGLPDLFQENVAEASRILGEFGCRLMPGGMHPWMDPEVDLRIWPHEYTEVYRAFDRIFSCRGHGWANLQSTHLNLPFRGDEEFARLHDAVRLVLPLIPALAASSPFLDGRPGPALDNRLRAYRDNARRVPSVTGRVVPERVGSRAEYRSTILERIYRDLEPLDPEGVLRDEWVNARGAIARFGRGSIEIRVIDAQECPRADLAVVAAVMAAVRWLAEGPLADGRPPHVPQGELVELLERTVATAGAAPVRGACLELFGLPSTEARAARDVWRHIVDLTGVARGAGNPWRDPLTTILEHGTLAERLRTAAGLPALPRGASRAGDRNAPGNRDVARGPAGSGGPVPAGSRDLPGDRGRLREVYDELCDCLERGSIFRGRG